MRVAFIGTSCSDHIYDGWWSLNVYLCLKFKYGKIAKPERVVFDQTLPLSEGGQMLRGIPLVVCLRGLARSFSVVQPADHQAFPPTHPRKRVGRPVGGARLTLLSIFSTLPGQPCINPIYPQSQVLPILLCRLAVMLFISSARRVSSWVSRRRPLREGRATAYCSGKQSYVVLCNNKVTPIKTTSQQ
jgi:hypothetical protein